MATSDHPLTASETIRVIEPTKGWLSLNLGEVWRYRDLLQILVWRNITVRYKQSVIGIGWALIHPVTSMVVFSLVFGYLAKLPSDGVPYPIFTYAALLPWTYFSGSLTSASSSLVGGAGLISKVYFPRLILPLSNLVTGLVDLAISFLVLLGMIVWYRSSIQVGWPILCLPLFLLLAILTALAVSLWLSALMVRYRDVHHLLPLITQVWMFLSPVAYTANLVPARWRLLYALNPMAGVIDGFRWALIGCAEPNWAGMMVSAAVTVLVLIGGLYYFRRTERTLVDIL